MTTVRSFNDEVKALEEYGHDCCARIDDRIHECCKRISEAHENEVAAVDLALRLKELQDFGYDVLGNERHKTALALKDCEFTYTKTEDNLEVLLVDGFGIRGSACYQEAFERLRDRLIYLLVGDQNPVKFSELFGILKEDDDGVDARPSDSASADSPVHGAAGCGCGVACGCDGEELLAPITQELREHMEPYRPIEDAGHVVVSRIDTVGFEGFDRLCDAIDAIHAQLEHDYQQACDVNERQDMQYAQLKAERDRLAAALNRDDGKYPLWAPESHYMMLPKDTDGVPIHVGDVMEWVDIEGTVEVTCTVEAVGVSCFFAWDKANKRFAQKLATSYRHHKPDTWERIIEDALDGYHDTDFDALVARCKALAGDADE